MNPLISALKKYVEFDGLQVHLRLDSTALQLTPGSALPRCSTARRNSMPSCPPACLHKALGVPGPSKRENMLTVVLRGPDGRQFGILVERLGDIPVVATADIAPMSTVFVGVTSMLASVVMTRGDNNGPMLTLLAVDKIAEMLNQEG